MAREVVEAGLLHLVLQVVVLTDKLGMAVTLAVEPAAQALDLMMSLTL